MDIVAKFMAEQGVGILIGVLMGCGLPALVAFLRADGKKKLTDKDPSNDIIGHVQVGLADVLDKNKVEIAKAAEKATKKK